VEKTIEIGGRKYRMRASALIPRLYRAQFGRDLVADMRQLQQGFMRAAQTTENDGAGSNLSAMDLTIFENVAWTLIRNAGEDIPDTPDEWLDSIDGILSIYKILPQILALWNGNQQTTSTAKKN